MEEDAMSLVESGNLYALKQVSISQLDERLVALAALNGYQEIVGYLHEEIVSYRQ